MIKITIVGKKNGKPSIRWMGVALSYLGMVVIIGLALLTGHVISKVALGYSFFTLNGWVILGVFLIVLVPSLMLVVECRRAMQIPLKELIDSTASWLAILINASRAAG
ncbi:MAG: hypothetical protein ACKVHR_15820 [Pirellulales bacterium]|jgi:uncharacterized membrane protein YedE/YeeE